MNNLVKVEQTKFGSLICDIFTNNKGEFFMTRQQIGQALGYPNPQKAIDKLHERHKKRLDKFSVTVILGATDKKNYETIVYSAKGVYEICRWSRQPKADQFYDTVYEILEGLRLGYLKLKIEHQTPQYIEARQQGKLIRRKETDAIKQFIEYAASQGSTHAMRYYTNLSLLADKAIGIDDRDMMTTIQAHNLRLIETIISKCIVEGMRVNKPYKDIYQNCKAMISSFIVYIEE